MYTAQTSSPVLRQHRIRWYRTSALSQAHFHKNKCTITSALPQEQAYCHKRTSTTTSALPKEQAHCHKRTSTRTSSDIRTFALAQRRAGSAAHPVANVLVLLRDTGRDKPHTSALPQARQGAPHTGSCAITSRERRTIVTSRFP
jgi:hypothetical protein